MGPLVAELLEPPVHPGEDVGGGLGGRDQPGDKAVVVVQPGLPPDHGVELLLDSLIVDIFTCGPG